LLPEDFDLLSSIREIQVIATGQGVRIKHFLRKKHGGIRWRKMKGIATVQENNGEIYEAEIHWYESHGIGRVDWKIKERIQ
jgi:hypothetical protein